MNFIECISVTRSHTHQLHHVSLGVVLVLGDPRVDELSAVLDHLPDEALLAELVEGLAGERPAHLQPLTHDGRGDELVGGHLFQELVVGGLVEEDQVVELVPGLSLGPLLLLGLAAAGSLLLGLGRGLRGLGVLLGSLEEKENPSKSRFEGLYG